MTEADDRAHLEALLQTYRRNLQLLEQHIASYGGDERAPIALLNQADDTRRKIADLGRDLALLNDEITPGAQSPYPGLLPFSRGQAHLFYGRSAERAELLELVRNKPLVAVIGASGSGKSSLVMAGLLPLLDQSWRVLCLTPGARPLRALADQLATLAPLEARMRLADDLEARLAQRTDGLTTGISTLLAEHLTGLQLVIVVDQIEELFTQAIGTPEEIRLQQRQFIINLKDTARVGGDRLRVVMTLRADFVGHWLNVPDIPRLPEVSQLLLRPMNTAARREAIVQPLEQAGVQFEQGLVERLLADTRDQPAALPLLQFTLAQLWQHRTSQLLTHAAYEEIGGVSGALDQRASLVYSQLSEPQQRLARNLFIRLVAMNEEVTYTRRRVHRDELRLARVPPEQVDQLIGILSRGDVRLIAAESDRVELAHEALIDHWSELRSWLETNHDRLMALRRLTEAAAEWHLHKRDPSFLYRGTRLAEARQIASASQSDINMIEQEFLARSVAGERRRRSVQVSAIVMAGLLALALCLAMVAEIGPFRRKLVWEASANLVGIDVTALEWSPDGVMYAGFSRNSADDSALARSSDGGRDWTFLPLKGRFVSALRLDPLDTKRLYVALYGAGVYRSSDSGEHWERIDYDLPLKQVDALAVSSSGALYVGALKGGGVFTSADHGNSWSRMHDSPSEQILGLRWLPACIDGANGCLLVGSSGGLWSWMAGGQWNQILEHKNMFDAIQLGADTIAIGEALVDLPKGAQAQEIAREPMTSIDLVASDPPAVIVGGLKGNLWQWRPGDAQLHALGERDPEGVTTIYVVRATPGAEAPIWVGSNNGLHRGSWRRWFELY